eukprot:6418928-Pyramimonas_sp.AAC.1
MVFLTSSSSKATARSRCAPRNRTPTKASASALIPNKSLYADVPQVMPSLCTRPAYVHARIIRVSCVK